MIVRAALVAAASLASPAASAQGSPGNLENLAYSLAYVQCPKFLSGQFPLTGNPRLEEDGFKGPVRTQQHDRFGELKHVTQTQGELTLAFGGQVGKICQLLLVGEGSAKVLASVRARVSPNLKPDPSETSTQADGSRVETLMARVNDKTVLKVQFLSRGLLPMAGFNMFMTD